MNASAVRLLATLLFLAAWIGATVALAWASNRFLNETRDFAGGVPTGFQVAVEEVPVAGAPPAYRYEYWPLAASRPLAAGESLHLSTRSYQFPGTCCYGFEVIEDGPDGQLIEFNADDMAYLRSRYRVQQGRVTPVLFRKDYTLYYLVYLGAGALVAGLGTAGLRRRMRSWAVPAAGTA